MTDLNIDAVSAAVWAKRKELTRQNRVVPNNLAVYMTWDFYQLCLAEIRGSVSTAAFSYSHERKIQGYPVYPVLTTIDDSNDEHPPFRVVQIL